MKQFIPILSAILLNATVVLGQSSIFPLVRGNQWTLKNTQNSSTVSVSIQYAVVVNGASYASWSLTSSWGSMTFLVSDRASGQFLDGLAYNGTEFRLPSGTLMFPYKGAAGDSWPSVLGTLSVTAANATVKAGGTSYTGCTRYQWSRTDGSVQGWALCPGAGPVEFFSGEGVFQLTSATLTPARPATVAVPGDCAAIGVASIPNDPALTLTARDAALQTSIKNGGKFLDIDATWNELEPQPGVFNLKRIQDEFSLLKKYGMKGVLTLKLIDHTKRGLPADLQSSDWAALTARLNLLLNRVLPLVPAGVRWINLGYEIDGYFFSHPTEINSFKSLVTSGKTYIKARTTLSVGTDFAFDSMLASNATFQVMSPVADHLTFDYYAQAAGFQQRTPDSPARDIPFMIYLAAGRPILLKEVGYPTSATSGSSEQIQSQFLANLFTALRATSGSFQGVSVWAARDLPSEEAGEVATQYDMDNDTAAAAFLGSLGLQTTVGVPKLAWPTYTQSAIAFGVRASCQTPSIQQ